MKDSLRLFIAIDFPKKIKEQISSLISELAKKYPGVRWEKEENLHLTLKFLGWVDTNIKYQISNIKTTNQKSKIQKIIEAMEKSVDGVKPFWFQPEKLGFFLRQNLIVWLAVKPQEGLFKIVDNLEREMAKIGFRKETRSFSPHATIGRGRKIIPRRELGRAAQEIENFQSPLFPKFKVSEIVLMKSQLTLNGSNYSVVTRVLLK